MCQSSEEERGSKGPKVTLAIPQKAIIRLVKPLCLAFQFQPACMEKKLVPLKEALVNLWSICFLDFSRVSFRLSACGLNMGSILLLHKLICKGCFGAQYFLPQCMLVVEMTHKALSSYNSRNILESEKERKNFSPLGVSGFIGLPQPHTEKH